MKILFKKRFTKAYQKLTPVLQKKVDITIDLFQKNVWDTKLHNHALKGVYLGCRSINATGDIRIIFREYGNGTYEVVEMIHLGTHSQLY